VLVIEACIQPTDIDQLHIGQQQPCVFQHSTREPHRK
jgi:hypothetical protein